jgi:hypothetical protein
MSHTAKFVEEISVIDPDTGGKVFMEVYKHEGGGMFAVDTSFLTERETEYELTIVDPFSEVEEPQQLYLESE